uniref:Midasin n=1 Tax=Angiostrongylus cantonensis TaxID=6313 RepID=A0A0K0D1U5_ANGCA
MDSKIYKDHTIHKVGWFVNHEQMSLSWNFLHLRTTKLLRLTEIMQRRIAHVPDTDVDEQELKEYEHPLSRLHDQSPELERLQRNVTELHSLSQHMNKIASTLLEESEKDVYAKASVIQHLECLSSDCTMLDAFLDDLQCWFEFECTQAKLVQKEIVAKLEVEIIETKTISVSLDGVLLFVQNLYKSLVENMSFNEMRTMDRLDYILEVITAADVSKVASWASQVVSDARTGLLMDPINEVTSLMRLVSSLLSSVNQMLSSVLQAFVGLYYVILSMSMQLFEKGYINPIPKMEKQEGDLTNASTGGEGGGFGEGEVSGDARDVTDEMEESGQIEGLQDDECEPTNGDAGQNKDPIEMDEDFADDMRDIDRGEATDHDMSDEGSEEAPQFEDILGEVDEADDQQLDPKLWDDEKKDKDPKEYDAGNTAADNKTDELTTNEHGTVEADEKPLEGEDEKDCCEQQVDAQDVDGQEHDEIQELEMMQDDPSTEFGDEEIQDTQDMTADKAENDSTDGEMENDYENNEGKVDGSEEVTEEANTMNSELDERETEHNTAELEAVQQGTGGEQKNLETSDKTGSANEEMNEECQNDEGKGSSKNDDRGEKGKSVKSVDNNEGKDEEEKEKTGEEENATEKKRELAHAAEDLEDKAKGEGELDDSGNQMQDSSSAEIQVCLILSLHSVSKY